MRKQFPGYYYPQEEEYSQKFKECVFCFDTNVLLNLYRYTSESRDNLIKTIQVVKDRVWLPHQVGVEFQRLRIDVFLSQIELSLKVKEILDTSIKEIEQLQRASLFAINVMIDPIKIDLNAIRNKLVANKDQKPNLMTGDFVFDAVTELFDGKVGDPYNQEKYREIYKKGRERYDAKIPPGYMDRSNNPSDTDQYGDFVLWSQLIDYSKGEPRPIILITDDAKNDWWREVRGEKLGPRPELISEFIAETGGNKWFYMYSTEQFLKYSKEYLNADVLPEVIKEAENIKKQDIGQEKNRLASFDFRSDMIRRALEQANQPSDMIRRALEEANQPSDMIRRALEEANRSSDVVRRAMEEADRPSDALRRAINGTETEKTSHIKKAELSAPIVQVTKVDKQANQGHDGKTTGTHKTNQTQSPEDEKKKE